MVAAAIAGVAVVGSSVIGSSAAKSSAKTAANAATQAADANLTNAREYRDKMAGYIDPLVPYAYAGTQSLASRFGLDMGGQSGRGAAPPMAGGMGQNPFGGSILPSTANDPGAPRGVTPTTPTNLFTNGGSGGSPSGPRADGQASAPRQDWKAYLQQNPDVGQNFASMNATPEGRAYFQQKGISTPEQAAQLHYQEFGQTEGRDPHILPASVYGVPDEYARWQGYGERPQTTRPDGIAPPEFTRGGDMQAPSMESFFSDFEADPGAAYRRSEALGGVNAASAVRGKLRSGDGAKALATVSSDLASQEYNNWFSRQMAKYQAASGDYRYGQNRQDNNFQQDRSTGLNLFQYQQDRGDRNYDLDSTRSDSRFDVDRNFNRGIFDTERGFAAGRFDTQTNNIFGLTQLGTGAINTMGGVGSSYLTAANNANNARADGIGNGAIAAGNATANLFGNAAQGIGAIYGAHAAPKNYFRSSANHGGSGPTTDMTGYF